jgi:PadR family transcriptional regulator PadR
MEKETRFTCKIRLKPSVSEVPSLRATSRPSCQESEPFDESISIWVPIACAERLAAASLDNPGKSHHASWHSLAMPRGEVVNRDEIPPGTLYLLILRTLARSGELHGYEIANSIQQISDDVLQVEEGSLYPALQRMLIKGWVTAKWGTTAGNRRARYYRLTTEGHKQLERELSQFERVIGAITRVIQTA